MILSNHFIHWDIVRTCWNWKQLGTYNRKLTLNSWLKISMVQLGQQRFLKCLGICFSQLLALSTLVFLLLQKFEFGLHVRYYCIIKAWSSDFNPFSYHQLWIGCVHQSCAANTSLRQELIGLSSLGAGDFIQRDLITFKICGMPSYGWDMVANIVHQLKLLQLFRFDDRSLSMAWVITIYQRHMTT